MEWGKGGGQEEEGVLQAPRPSPAQHTSLSFPILSFFVKGERVEGGVGGGGGGGDERKKGSYKLHDFLQLNTIPGPIPRRHHILADTRGPV